MNSTGTFIVKRLDALSYFDVVGIEYNAKRDVTKWERIA